jgi:hypothetical protein
MARSGRLIDGNIHRGATDFKRIAIFSFFGLRPVGSNRGVQQFQKDRRSDQRVGAVAISQFSSEAEIVKPSLDLFSDSGPASTLRRLGWNADGEAGQSARFTIANGFWACPASLRRTGLLWRAPLHGCASRGGTHEAISQASARSREGPMIG